MNAHTNTSPNEKMYPVSATGLAVFHPEDPAKADRASAQARDKIS